MTRACQQGVAHGGPLSPPTILRFPGTELAIELQDAPDVDAALSMVLKGWFPARAAHPVTQRLSRVTRAQDGYTTQSPFLAERISGLGVAGAACAVLADLAQDYFETRAGCLSLHCAAFRLKDRLIAVTGPARAGKSTLAARMTQEADIELFCDDVLPITRDNLAIALGIAPRLRLPLPASASPAFRAHVARHLGPRDARYGYLCAPTIAPHGTPAPLAVLLILDRRDAAPARLHAVAEDEALRFLLARNMADLQSPKAAFTRLTALLAGLTCLRLVYADLEEAVALIRRAFATGAGGAPGPEIGPILPDPATLRLPAADLCLGMSWSRNPDVVTQTRAEGAFLWVPGRQMIWHLNSLGRAIWALLEIPGTATELAATLQEVFPDQHQPDLVRDVNSLLHALSKEGLIEQAARARES